MRRCASLALAGAAILIGSCGGGSSAPDAGQAIALPATTLLSRAGESITDTRVIDQKDLADAIISIVPPLPAGLSIDPLTGVIAGTATQAHATRQHEITLDGQPYRTIDIAVGATLPAPFESLDERYTARILIDHAAAPVRLAKARDGRIFFNELSTGNIRVIDPAQGLLATPVATLAITSGAENGLLGLALDPEFDTNGYLYVHATVPSHDGGDAHAQIIRLTVVQNLGVNPTVIVDQLPIAAIHNGGDLVFDRSGHLFVGRGDISRPATAQTTGDLSGKILRYTRDGAIPADNPFPGDPEWARGIRNTFAMTLQPQTGDLFGADAGPASDDKLNYLMPAKNFTWGLATEAEGSDIGFTIRTWPEVITPTGLHFHSGTHFSDLQNNLLLTSYNDESIVRLVLTGERFTDFIREIEFAQFHPDGINNKPLHLIEADDGGLYVSTFNAIYHVYPIETQ